VYLVFCNWVAQHIVFERRYIRLVPFWQVVEKRRFLCVYRICDLCCSVLQCVAVCCSVLQRVAACCSVLQCVAVRCSVLQCTEVCCAYTTGALPAGRRKRAIPVYTSVTCVAMCCSMLQFPAGCCNVSASCSVLHIRLLPFRQVVGKGRLL